MRRAKKPAAASGRVPRLHAQDGRWYWKPEKRLRPTWKNQPLGEDHEAAKREARKLNAEVDAWLKTPAAKAGQPEKKRRGPVTVGTIIADYKASAAWKKLRPRTRDGYTYELKRLETEFGHEVAGTLDTVRVDDWWDAIRQTAPETGRHMAARGRVLFAWAGRKGMVAITHNPFAKMGFGGGNKRRFRFLWEDVKHIVAVADEEKIPSIGTALVIGFCCMQRITDVIRLDTSHIVGQIAGRRRLRFHQSKGEKIRERGETRPGFFVDMPLPAAVEDRLGELLKQRHAAPAPLFVSEETGKPHHEKTISRVFARLLKKAIRKDPQKWAHLTGGQLRDGRRSGFVHVIEGGCTVELATSWSGHSIQEGYDILEHYMPRTAKMADEVSQFMKVSL